MAYMLALAFDEENKDLSPIAIIGALGDRQDNGPRPLPHRASTGRRWRTRWRTGLVTVSKDFLFHGRETRPIHEAIAMTYTPYIAGLSGAKDARLAALSNAGFVLKEHGRWRNLAELSTEEKQKLLEVLTSFISVDGGGSAVISELIGEVYSLRARGLADSPSRREGVRDPAQRVRAGWTRPTSASPSALGDRDRRSPEATEADGGVPGEAEQGDPDAAGSGRQGLDSRGRHGRHRATSSSRRG